MEIFPYIFSVLLTALVIWWSRSMAARPPGKPVTGLFRYRDRPGKPLPPAPPPQPRASGAVGR
jgi:hypothetical protein